MGFIPSARTDLVEKIPSALQMGFFLEAPPGFEPGDKGFADPCLTTWLWRHIQNRSIIPRKASFVNAFCKLFFSLFEQGEASSLIWYAVGDKEVRVTVRREITGLRTPACALQARTIFFQAGSHPGKHQKKTQNKKK